MAIGKFPYLSVSIVVYYVRVCVCMRACVCVCVWGGGGLSSRNLSYGCVFVFLVL